MHLAAAIIQSTRPRQWSKNVLLFAAILFSKNIFQSMMIAKVFAGFALFCVITGTTYLFNDILDLEKDRFHPEKSKRPIAAGKLSVRAATATVVIMVLFGLWAAWWLDIQFFIVIVFYLLLQLSYSTVLKKMVILDVLAITCGFVVRVVAGAIIIHVAISPWLLACTFLLALFIALCKRRHELMLLGGSAKDHRSVLGDYSIQMLDLMISVSTASTVLAYTLYTLSKQTIAKFGTEKLIYTVPFVVYGILRYLYIVYYRKSGGSPETVLLTDIPLISGIALWVSTATAIIYF